MRILAMETATPAASVALLEERALVREVSARVPQRHLEWLAPAIGGLLDEVGWRPGDVDAVAVSTGPGSFTGLRIGIATAAAWARARDLPVIGVPTLQVVAEGTSGAGLLCPVLDARRGEVAFALFERNGEVARVMQDTVGSVGALLARMPGGRVVIFSGDGVPRVRDGLRTRPQSVVAPEAQWPPRAAMTGQVAWRRLSRGERDDLYLLRPVYARGAGISRSRRHVLPEAGEGNPGQAEEE